MEDKLLSNQDVSEQYDARKFNKPKTSNYFTNQRQQKLHIRNFIPSDANKIDAVIFWLHGIYAHVNGPRRQKLGELMISKGIALMAFDQAGHGYSEGERGYIEDHTFLVDDALCYIDLVYSTKTNKDCSLGLSPELLERFQQVPFFVAGESMGGGLAVLVCLELQKRSKRPPLPWENAPMPKFQGALLSAPALVGNLPPAPIVWLLQNTCLHCCPMATIPKWLETVHKPELLWKREEDRLMVEADGIDKPGGLGWGRTMRLRTGFSMITMCNTLQSVVGEIEYPFFIVHDPDDGIVKFSGSLLMLHRSKTSSEEGVIQEMPGCLHDLLTNDREIIVDHLVAWINKRRGVIS